MIGDVVRVRIDQLTESDRTYIEQFFTAHVYPVLMPLAIDPGRHPAHVARMNRHDLHDVFTSHRHWVASILQEATVGAIHSLAIIHETHTEVWHQENVQ